MREKFEAMERHADDLAVRADVEAMKALGWYFEWRYTVHRFGAACTAAFLIHETPPREWPFCAVELADLLDTADDHRPLWQMMHYFHRRSGAVQGRLDSEVDGAIGAEADAASIMQELREVWCGDDG